MKQVRNEIGHGVVVVIINKVWDTRDKITDTQFSSASSEVFRRVRNEAAILILESVKTQLINE